MCSHGSALYNSKNLYDMAYDSGCPPGPRPGGPLVIPGSKNRSGWRSTGPMSAAQDCAMEGLLVQWLRGCGERPSSGSGCRGTPIP